MGSFEMHSIVTADSGCTFTPACIIQQDQSSLDPQLANQIGCFGAEI
jgi:hypothetical protein